MGRASSTIRNSGFSLIELVIVVVIIAIIGAIAIPRMSRGAAGAAESALVGDLAVLRNAIDLYAAEHGGAFPGTNSSTATFSATLFVEQLTQYSNAAGETSDKKTTTSDTGTTEHYIYGPYLRKMPPLPVGLANKGETGVVEDTGTAVPGGATGGWFYNPATGEIRANTSGMDARGAAYSTY